VSTIEAKYIGQAGNTYSDTVFCFADTVVLLRIDTPFLLDRHSDFTL
jgi:hypothetical protein